MGRLEIEWSILPVTDRVRSGWEAVRDGLPRIDLMWSKRRRQIATLWINPDFAPTDYRNARDAFATGPLPQYGIRWRCTWHTWDGRGVGGVNADEADLATAIESALFRCLVQRFIPDLRCNEAEGVLLEAARLSEGWRMERGLRSVRWGYG